MHGGEKSDLAIVAVKPANNSGQPDAERVEPRAGAEGNVGQQRTRRAQDRASVSQGLDRIRKAAKERKKERFTALLHHVDVPMLRTAFYALRRDAAPGADGLTWQDYETDLDHRIEDLHDRVHRGAYRAQPSRRRFIPKPDGRQRPLAIAALEDKIVQRAVAMVLNAIYEEDFLGFSYGFRPGRSQHDALDALVVGIGNTKVNWILDADIRSFFDMVSQEWLVRFVEHRVGDRRIIRLIQKWLRAGILEDEVVTVSERGTGQGSVISPLLANIYLHYVFDLWANRWRQREATGDMIVVRYADDIVVGFEHEADAHRFLGMMRARLEEFALTLHPEKTRLIRIRPPSGGAERKARAGQAGNFQLPGLYLDLRQVATWQVPAMAEIPARPVAGEASGGDGGNAAADAPADPPTRGVAATGGHRVFCLSRGADQHPCSPDFPRLRGSALAAVASATRAARQDDVGADQAAGRGLPAEAAHPPSLARATLRRQTPEVGAVCGNAARTALCGGRAVMRVPTAIQTL